MASCRRQVFEVAVALNLHFQTPSPESILALESNLIMSWPPDFLSRFDIEARCQAGLSTVSNWKKWLLIQKRPYEFRPPSCCWLQSCRPQLQPPICLHDDWPNFSGTNSSSRIHSAGSLPNGNEILLVQGLGEHVFDRQRIWSTAADRNVHLNSRPMS